MNAFALADRPDEFLHRLSDITPDEMLPRPVAVERLPRTVLRNAPCTRSVLADHDHGEVPNFLLLTPHERFLLPQNSVTAIECPAECRI
jgi:hypothetical protein